MFKGKDLSVRVMHSEGQMTIFRKGSNIEGKQVEYDFTVKPVHGLPLLYIYAYYPRKQLFCTKKLFAVYTVWNSVQRINATS